MTLSEYQEQALQTAVYPEAVALAYTTMGLVGEAGEIANKVKKIYRDHNGVISDEHEQEIAKELGDVLWYIAAIAYEIGFKLDDVALMNLKKLNSRKQRGVIAGDGDNR